MRQALCMCNALDPLDHKAGSINHPHFAEGETKAQRRWVTCPRSQSQQMTELVANVHHASRVTLGLPQL